MRDTGYNNNQNLHLVLLVIGYGKTGIKVIRWD